MTERPGELVDTSDMLAVHAALRRQTQRLPALASAAATASSEDVNLIAQQWGIVSRFLEGHHQGEDLLLYPLMRDRAPESAEMIDSMEDEHRRLHSAQARADAIVAEWSETGVGNRSEECAALASELVELLAAHSNREETELLPMVPGVITVEEWAQLPEHAQRNARPEDLPFVLGMIMEVMPVEARGFMLASLPEPVQQAWDAYGSAAFAAHDAEVRRLAGE